MDIKVPDDQEPEYSKGAEDEACQNNIESPLETPSAATPPNMPCSPINEADTYQEKNYRLSKRQLAISKWTLVILAIYTGINAYQAYQMRKATDASKISADAATKAANTSAKQLEMTERPWIYATNWSLIEPLSFTDKGGRISVGVTLRNTGHSPAINVRFVSKIIGFLSTEDLLKRQVEYCDFWKKRSTKGGLPGNIIFPSEQLPYSESTDMNNDEIRIALQKSIIPGKVSPILIVCIDYQFSFDSQHHQTRYAFPLGRPQKEGGWMGFFVPKGTPDGVVLIPTMMGELAD